MPSFLEARADDAVGWCRDLEEPPALSQPWRGVSGQQDPRVAFPWAQLDQAQRGEGAFELISQCAFENRKRRGRILGQPGDSFQRLADAHGQSACERALAGNVADEEQDVAVGEGEPVVEVTPDQYGISGRLVERRHRPTGHLRQPRRQQYPLESCCDVVRDRFNHSCATRPCRYRAKM